MRAASVRPFSRVQVYQSYMLSSRAVREIPGGQVCTSVPARGKAANKRLRRLSAVAVNEKCTFAATYTKYDGHLHNLAGHS